jgi:GNAT superfamily N-acetyltransferase
MSGVINLDLAVVNEKNVEIVSQVLIKASEWLCSTGQLMWKASDLTVQKLLKQYDLKEMRICYENNNLIGVFIIQWKDPLFWAELKENESGYLHKLAVCREYSGMGYGEKLIQAAEVLCKEKNIEWLRLNCGTFRPRLRSFYENAGFKMVDRVFIDNRDQIRYMKKVV